MSKSGRNEKPNGTDGFSALLRGLVRVPKAEVEDEEAKWQQARKRKAAARKKKR